MILAIACCVYAVRLLFRICDWNEYIEAKANSEYIQCSTKMLEIMLNTLVGFSTNLEMCKGDN